MPRRETLDRAHFDRLYAIKPDPWRYASSPYEAAKYAATLQALPRDCYGHALDVGCSIGVLTEQLATRCDDLLAIEPVEAALDQARRRCARHANVRFQSLFVPREWPEGRYELILISEVLDYLGTMDLANLAERLAASLLPGGDLVLVHWVGKKAAVSDGSESTDILARLTGDTLVPISATRNRNYRLDIFQRR